MRTEMREPTFWVLTVLAAGRRHGYALIRETSELSGGRVHLKVATLYAALERLEKAGWVAPDGDETVDGRQRRYFKLTAEGHQALVDEVARIEANASQAKSRLASTRPAPRMGAIS